MWHRIYPMWHQINEIMLSRITKVVLDNSSVLSQTEQLSDLPPSACETRATVHVPRELPHITAPSHGNVHGSPRPRQPDMIDTWHFTLNTLQPELSLHVIVDYDLHTVNTNVVRRGVESVLCGTESIRCGARSEGNATETGSG
jgi:hypothetical protein